MISETANEAFSAHEDQSMEQIDAKIEQNIRFYATQQPEAISTRIEELDRECDLDRSMALYGSGIGLGTILLSFIGGKKWLVVGGTALGFLFKHCLDGTSPVVPLLRKLGVRTRSEIDREKYALKILRGDFADMPKPDQLKNNPAKEVLRSIRS
ncbi:MAG TPA: hypothetical protein VK850_11990 [Candidatus Binatia bacterium]|nr:hypothetical protein [Candidatus Binatia bacterium]